MSAATIFKVAGNRLNQLYSRYKARIIIPLHDAFIFEAPLEVLPEVARLTEQVMCQVVQEYFPQLEPRVEVNIDQPHCWNEGGNAEFPIYVSHCRSARGSGNRRFSNSSIHPEQDRSQKTTPRERLS